MKIDSAKPGYGHVHMKKILAVGGVSRASRKRSKSGERIIDRAKASVMRKSASTFGRRSHCSMAKPYNQDSTVVPSYYSRPGPGLYHDFAGAGVGERSQVSKFTNSPSYFIQRPRDWEAVRERLERSRSKSNEGASQPGSPELTKGRRSQQRSLEKKPDLTWTRFYNYTEDQTTKKLHLLHPNREMVTKNQNRIPFGKAERVMPFIPKPEHTTRCQHVVESKDRKAAGVSDLTIIHSFECCRAPYRSIKETWRALAAICTRFQARMTIRRSQPPEVRTDLLVPIRLSASAIPSATIHGH